MNRMASIEMISWLAACLLTAVVWMQSPVATAATTTYTGAWAGGTIAPGDTAILDNGASITGNVEANGLLQFNQTSALTMSAALSGTGGLALTNTGTFILTGLTSGTGRFDLAITASRGALSIGTTGTNPLVVGDNDTGSLSVTGGTVRNGAGFLGFAQGSLGTATVTSGSWTNSRILYVGHSGTGTLDISGGLVTNANGYLGFGAGGVGTATVSSGTWQNRGQLLVGGAIGGTGGTGSLTMTGGQIINSIGYIAAGTNSVGTVTISGGTWSNSANLNVGNTGTGTLTISGSGGTGGLVIVGGALSKGTAGTINLNAGGTLQIGTGSASGALATDLVNNGAVVFNRIGSGTVAASISGTGSLTMTGAGTLRFSGTSSYSGATAINAGALLVNGGLGGTAVSVNNAGLLGGSGTIGGHVTVSAGGTLAPGDGIGSLAIGGATLLDGAGFAYEINSFAPLAADLLTVTGDLSLAGTVGLTLIDLATTPAAFADGTTFSLINYTGDWNGGLFTYGGSTLADGGIFTVGDQLWRIDYDAAGGGLNFVGEHLSDSQFLNIVAVPEPSSCVLLFAGLCGIFWQFCPSGASLSPIQAGDGRRGRSRLHFLGFHAVIDIAIDWESLTTSSDSLASPHTWLGLDADVSEPAAIVQAARHRLETIRDAYGSEREVKDVLVSIIVRARQEMLSRARVG
jgi:T5SS/PEP-CTERM-associated repeat protein/autotransporter-associated beta strand protein